MKWEASQILDELRRRRRRKVDLSHTGIRTDPIFSAAYRHFGSYRTALEAAHIDPKSVSRRRFTKWTQRKIVRELQTRHRRGEDIWSRGLRLTEAPLHAAAIHWFGSYRAAVEAAGIDYYKEVCHNLPKRWDRKTIIAEIQRLHRKRQPLNHARLERNEPCLVIAMYRYFGNFRKAIAAAGIDYSTVMVRPARTWHPPRVIRELKQIHREGTGLWNRALRRRAPYLLRAAKQLFGSVPRAFKSAGISPDARIAPKRVPRPPLAKSTVLARLRVLEGAGADLRAAQLVRTHRHLYFSMRHHFGGHREALTAAGIDYPPARPLRHWTRPLVLQTLRELHGEGTDLRYSPMKRLRRPLYEAAKYYFGSYVKAVAEAGIDYDRMVARQLAKRRRRLASVAGRYSITRDR